jgi:hypothetical protein
MAISQHDQKAGGDAMIFQSQLPGFLKQIDPDDQALCSGCQDSGIVGKDSVFARCKLPVRPWQPFNTQQLREVVFIQWFVQPTNIV